MRRGFWKPVFCFLLLTALAGSTFGDEGTSKTLVLEQVLEEARTSREDLRPDPMRILAGLDSESSMLLRALSADPLRAPYRVAMTADRFRDEISSPHRLVMTAGGLAGARIARGYIGNPLREIDRALLDASDPLAWAFDQPEFAGADLSTLPPVEDFPLRWRAEVGRLVAVLARAERFRKRAFRNLPDDVDPDALFEQVARGRFLDFDAADYRVYIRDLELEALVGGFLDVIAAVEDFHAFASAAGDVPRGEWSVDTPLGTVVYTGPGRDDRHEVVAPLLLLDLGGDDTYFEEDRGRARTGLSVIYDRAGDDRHWSEPGRGSGAFFGYGLTFDGGGDDVHGGAYLSAAGALFGVAALVDLGGNDRYESTAYSQAYALGGVALLADLGEDDGDVFESVITSQASAGPFAAAVLLNAAGDDVYTLANDPLLEPSPQAPDRNASMGQGMATGVRADLGDGRSLPGGVALLLDAGGNDVYTAEVFAQGTGYLQGTGLLVDEAGDDTYRAHWYAQGAGAHGAAGVLLDRRGNDEYTARTYVAQGAAHDDTVALLVDAAGNDRYAVRSFGMGAANDNGVGILADFVGDDRYELEAGEAFGLGAGKITKWGTTRESSASLGLFFDLGGDDVYTVRREGPANDTVWAWPRKYPDLDLPSEAGAGIDGVYTEPPFRLEPWTADEGEDARIREEAVAARRAFRDRWKGD